LHSRLFDRIFVAPLSASRPVTPKNQTLDSLVAIATDLLAQIEAQQRASRRLEAAVRLLSLTARDNHASPQTIDEVQMHFESLRRLAETGTALLAEFEGALSGAT
jgi:predicted component of type VI protein secretion system